MIEHKKNLDKFRINERYETEEYIGSGSTGIVYKGKDLLINRLVAIKALKAELSQNEKFINSLSMDLKEIFNLENEHIIKFYELIKEKDRYFVIMEYFDSVSLDEMLKKGKEFSIDFSINLISQVSDALNYCSRKNIFHKALKPENILITKENKIKITDFGFAKAIATAWLTLTGTSPTHVEYMSPEQAEGEPSDQRTDIYSLGIIAYQLLTGEVPFKREGTSILSVAMKHINSKPELLTIKNPNIPTWLENIVLKCLEKSPNSRFEHGSDLLMAINNRDEITKKFMRKVIYENDEVFEDDKLDIENNELLQAINEGFAYKPNFDSHSTLIVNDIKAELERSKTYFNKNTTEIILRNTVEDQIDKYFVEDNSDSISSFQDLKDIIGDEDNSQIREEKNSINKILIYSLILLLTVIFILLGYILSLK